MTSTDLTTPTPAPVVTTESMALIESTAASLGHAHKIASALCTTAFVPAHFKGKPEEAAAGILYGSQIGMDPLTALQNVFVIGGRPALYSRAMVAVVLAAGHRVWTEESTAEQVTVSGQRRGSDVVETVTWTPERAKLAGYTTNKKYQTDPVAMLYARASGDVARRIAPDALLGMAHTVEEMEVVEARDVTPRRQSAADVLGTSEASAEADRPAEPEPNPNAPTERRKRAMFAAFNESNVTSDRAGRLAWISGHVGRDIESSNDLTAEEVEQVISELQVNTAHADGILEGAQDEEVQA